MKPIIHISFEFCNILFNLLYKPSCTFDLLHIIFIILVETAIVFTTENLSHHMRAGTLAMGGLHSLKYACAATQKGQEKWLCLVPYIIWANIEGSGKTECKRRLIWAFAVRICDKYLSHGLTHFYHINEPPHDKTNKTICALSEDSDQPGHLSSLMEVIAVRSMGS